MALDFNRRKKKKPLPAWGELTLPQQQELAPGAPVMPGSSWQDIINADPLLGGELGGFQADEIGDRSQTTAAMRDALIRMGGAGLAGAAGSLGAEWSDLLDPATLAAAQAGDQSGLSISAQLEKQNADRLEAEADIRAAKGMASSGSTGYQMGEARQAHTIAGSNALQGLMQALKGAVGGFSGRQKDRNAAIADARKQAMDRAIALGLSPIAPRVAAPPTSPAMIQQLRRNARRPVRRPIREYEGY